MLVVTATSWHPPRALLEIVELVLDGALPPLPDVLGLLGIAEFAELARRADPTGPDLPPEPPFTIEDGEGTPVARVEPGLVLVPDRPFSAPPLRAHRLTPAEATSDGVLTVAMPGLPGADNIVAVIGDAARRGLKLRWLVLVGSGRGPLTAEGAWRVARGLVREAERKGVDSDVVPVVVPLISLPQEPGAADRPWDAAHADLERDPLAAEVVRRYANDAPWRVLPAVKPEHSAGPAIAELARTVRPPARRGVTVFFTGLSGSGKSTLARGLAARLGEDGRRSVTLLDGDEVRRLLSYGLGFSRADRDMNIRRIGYLATEVTRHGGIAICAPIAPFAAVRAQVRAAVEAVGDLVLVHVATPLAVCERRDRKGLYAQARRGEIPEFTGISSPYEEPADADLVVDTTDRDVDECLDQVWALLEKSGYLGNSDL